MGNVLLHVTLYLSVIMQTHCFLSLPKPNIKNPNYTTTTHFSKDTNSESLSKTIVSDYATSEKSSKTIVSTLTNIVNAVMKNKAANDSDVDALVSESQKIPAPTTPIELMKYIENDYTLNNYLWTGNIYYPAFELKTRFTDPTLSFVGLDTYITNIQNLKPVLNFVLGSSNYDNCSSELLSIELNEDEKYVQTRWRMLGSLDGLFWRPTIDVIGQTKFWFREAPVNDENRQSAAFKVFFYDESWEISAIDALKQILTPAS